MLSDAHFFHRLTKKYVTLFGNMFNNITMMKVNQTTGIEIERMKVPILYAPKEKYYTRLRSDPELQREVGIVLPRMSFELQSIAYDASRKQNPLIRHSKANTSTGVTSQYMPVPYDLVFELNIYARNIDDGDHIIEQILPYFNPDYTVTITPIPELDLKKDIAIILNSVNPSIEHEGNYDSIRFVTWTLSFTMKVYYFGPISNPKIIRKVISNIFNDPSLKAGYIIRINTSSGNNGDFKLDDVVYQGDNYQTANAYGIVLSWANTSGKLALGGAQGNFTVGSTIKAYETNASYTLASFDASPLKLATITIEPDPLDALPNSDFGYTTTIAEFGNGTS